MDFPTIGGLPAHPLIVHATVVLVPLAAAAVALHAFWPAARARLGLVTLGTTQQVVRYRPLRRQGLVERRSVHSEALTPSAGGCP
jgi:hypothetical protein